MTEKEHGSVAMGDSSEAMIDAAAQALADQNHSLHPEAFRGIAECALEAALSVRPVQEPVAWRARDGKEVPEYWHYFTKKPQTEEPGEVWEPLYAAPQPAWQPVANRQDGNRPLPFDREQLGRFVREAWVRWAETQPNPKPSWTVPYDQLPEADKEADRQIGEAVSRWTLIGDAARSSPAPARDGVEVKKLEWRDGRDDKTVFPVFQIAVILGADNLDGLDYAVIGPDRHDLYEVVLGNKIIKSRGSEADAKDAAQADYQQRILSALATPTPKEESK